MITLLGYGHLHKPSYTLSTKGFPNKEPILHPYLCLQRRLKNSGATPCWAAIGDNEIFISSHLYFWAVYLLYRRLYKSYPNYLAILVPYDSKLLGNQRW